MEWFEALQHPQATQAEWMERQEGAPVTGRLTRVAIGMALGLLARPNLGMCGRICYEMPAAIALVDILDGEAT
jgi:hypothetical protein